MSTFDPSAVPIPSIYVRRRRYADQIHLILNNYYAVLDEVPDFLWCAIDGRSNVEQLAAAMCQKYDCAAEAALDAIYGILDVFVQEGFVTIAPTARGGPRF